MWKSLSTIHILGLGLPESQRRTPNHYRDQMTIFSQTLFRVQEHCFLRKICTIQISVWLKVILFWMNAGHLHFTKRRTKNRIIYFFFGCLRADNTASLFVLQFNHTVYTYGILTYVYDDSFHYLQHILDLDLLYLKGENLSTTKISLPFATKY